MKQITVYNFDELSDAAKQRAYDDYMSNGFEFHWWNEWQNSVNAFAEIAPAELIRSDIACGHVDIRWTDDDAVSELSGVRAWKWLLNNGWFELAAKNVQGDCTLTGYCGDCGLFDPIHALRNQPARVPDLKQLFYECFQSWAYDCRNDYEYQQSYEYVSEHLDGNEYEYLEDGRML